MRRLPSSSSGGAGRRCQVSWQLSEQNHNSRPSRSRAKTSATDRMRGIPHTGSGVTGALQVAQPQSGDLEGLLDPPQDHVGRREHGPPLGQGFGRGQGGEYLAPRGKVAEPGSQVHGVADVVVPLVQDDVADGDAAADRDVLGDPLDAELELEQGGEHGRGVHPDQHGPVAEPLGDAYAAA